MKLNQIETYSYRLKTTNLLKKKIHQILKTAYPTYKQKTEPKTVERAMRTIKCTTIANWDKKKRKYRECEQNFKHLSSSQ